MDDRNPQLDPSEIALSFKNLGISLLHPPTPILSNVSGYVKRGGITAVMGASASGKSILMKALAGRMQNLYIHGDINIDGSPMDPYDVQNEVSYVPQDDFLMGELSARETLTNNYMMKDASNVEDITEDVNKLLKSFGIDHVADTLIGTPFFRGISGGQRKRVEVCSELICPTSVLLLDEPTSGLDGAVAYEILSVIKQILKEKKGKLSIMISIHQPNSRILELFDHLLLLGSGGDDAGGGSLFFGTVPESIAYFTSIGFTPPEGYTPTDVFLQITDKSFGTNYDFDFEGTFACSNYAAKLNTMIDENARSGRTKAIADVEQSSDWKSVRLNQSKVADADGILEKENRKDSWFLFWRQYYVLVLREYTLAKRDPSLYYLQCFLASMFGFMIGAVFFQLKAKVDNTINNITAGLLWIVFFLVYLQVFKVYHLNRGNIRFKHEKGNRTYSVLAYWLAELTATAVGLVVFLPGATMAYFMMGQPGAAYPFLLLLFWLTALTSESMLNVISKFSEVSTVSIVTSQLYLVVLTVFGGGVFISWRDCPIYWQWLQEISLYTQASRAAIMDVSDHISYECQSTTSVCQFGGYDYPCDDYFSAARQLCTIHGRTVLKVYQGTLRNESKWVPFGYLMLMLAVSRFTILFLMYYPPQRLMFMFKDWMSGAFNRVIIANIMGLRRVERQFNSYLKISGIVDGTISEPTTDRTMLVSQKSTTISYRESNHDDVFFEENPSNYDYKASENPCLKWTNLSVTLPKGQVLIDNISGVAQSGRIVALMGPSGAGKTTLLNALGHRAAYAKVTGQVMFGGRALTPEDLVYVPQFDEFNDNLSVFEQLEFVGRMKCADLKSMYSRLKNLLRILGLADRSKTLCKNLTGGQLKRVSVGMGMISSPNILFLDEPTTGLDSSAAYSIVKYVTELSKITKVVVILTIHQPAQTVFDMLQDLYLLESGRLAYFGPIASTKQYFTQLGFSTPADVNPADFFLDLVSKPPSGQGIAEGTTWTDLYKNSVFAKNFAKVVEIVVEKSNSRGDIDYTIPSNEFYRLATLMELIFKYYTRDIGFYYLRLLYLVIVALFTGTIFLQLQTNTKSLSQYSGAIFFSIWTILFSAVAATGLLAADRRQAVEQVKNAVITPGVYCFAQFLVSIPFNFIVALIYQAIFHWMVNLNPRGETFIYAVLITTEHMLMMEAIMLTVVAVLKNAMLSVTFAMCVMGYLFLFPGFFILNRDMAVWIAWFSWITPTFYSFDGYLWMIYESQDFDISGGTGKMSGTQVLAQFFGLHDINPWAMFGVMIAWIALFRLSHYGAFLFDVRHYLAKPEPKSKQTVGVTESGQERQEKGELELV